MRPVQDIQNKKKAVEQMREYGLIHDSTELRKLMQENPGLPIIVCAREEANGGEWAWQYCADVSCSITEILDVRTPYDDDERVFDNRDEFLEAIEDVLYDNAPEGKPLEEIEAEAKVEAEKYAQYWRKAIIVYASN